MREAPRAAVRRWTYRASDAGGRPLDHFRWIRHNAGLVERIAAWAEFPAPEGVDGRRGGTPSGARA
ncbi:hypothetical protein ACQ86F_09470 [Streptomyces venezuelae ATCC 10712]